MKTKFRSAVLALLTLSTLNSQLATASAQGTAFTYQGRLNDGANPANGSYDLRFAIYNSVSAGVLIAGPLTNSAVGVTNGLFTVTLDFGGIFTGTNYWLDIGARTNGAGVFAGLTPRPPITPTPYAIFASTASNISGTLADAQLSANVALRAGGNTFTEAQIFNGSIALNNSGGFDQSSAGAFLIDAPFLPGGRFAVLANGNVGIGNASPVHTLDVGGDVGLPLPATFYAAGNTIFRIDVNGNSFLGDFAGNVALSGGADTGIGYGSLYFDTAGSYNTAVGFGSLNLNTNGSDSTAIGAYALVSNTGGNANTAIGYLALYSNTIGNNNTANGVATLYANTSGSDNTANGYQALDSNTTGGGNVGHGENALYANINGNFNTAIGHGALAGNTVGSENIALGHLAGYNITTGTNNIDIGNQGLSTDANIIRIGSAQAATFIAGSLNLSSNLVTILSGGNLLLRADTYNENFFAGPIAGNSTMSGIRNTGVGNGALHSNLSGTGNTASGDSALYYNTTGTENTANGFNALLFCTTAIANTADGYYALGNNKTGGANTADGDSALIDNVDGFGNTATGYHALFSNTNGSYNIAVGFQAGFNLTSTTSNIDIGNSGISGDAGTIRIGAAQAKTFIAGISGVPVSGSTVVVSSSGQLGVAPSSQRFKQNIQTMGDVSDVLLALQPVTFRYKPEIDPNGLAQFGLIAEQVEKVDPDLVVHDQEHGIYTVRYEAVNAMLLNEFLKQHRKIVGQNTEIEALRQKNEILEKRLENLEQMVKSFMAKN